VKKLFSISFFLIFCFTLTFLNGSKPAIAGTNVLFSSFHPSHSFSDLSFNHPNSEIEIGSIHNSTASHGTHGFQKIFGYVASDPGNLNKYIAFSFSDNRLPGYLFHKKYLSHIYPSHNFWWSFLCSPWIIYFHQTIGPSALTIHYLKKTKMSTVIIALILVGFIALIIGLLKFVHKRDQKKDAANKAKTV